jgi:type II secretory pathway predicted ATPase ExeA
MQPFQLFGATIPPLIGRTSQMQQLVRELSKQTPSHITVVGPKYAGKSVLLKALADHLQQDEKLFSAVVFWDLAHHTPGTDDEFVRAFAEQLAASLPDYASLLKTAGYRELKEILAALGDESIKILMVWDGFDKPLRAGQLTRNLWDNMRELASLPNLRIVTASRRPLQELISNEKSATSDFWGLFNVTVKVGPFDDSDLGDVLESRLIPLGKGARTEIVNCAGFFPPVILALLNDVMEQQSSGEVSNTDVTSCLERTLEANASLLASIWEDCDQIARDLFFELSEGDIPVAETSAVVRAALTDRGLAMQASGKLRRSSRLMESYVASQQADRGSLKRQFGSEENYARNMHAALQLRLAQLADLDGRLKRLMELCFEDLPGAPDLCLTHLRDVGVRICDLMLLAELGSQLEIPSAWISNWTANEFVGRNGEPLRTPDWFSSTKCPRENRERIDLLRLMINPRNVAPEARKCSRLGVEQLQLLKRLGDYGEHSDRDQVTSEAALSGIHLAIEAAATLCNDLRGAQ